MIRCVLLLGVWLLLRSLAVADPVPLNLAWHEKDGELALASSDQVLWCFRYGEEDAKSCFHPLALPGHEGLTWFRPEDHRWHRGLWFSWKYINGINYWEEDPVTGQSAGQTEVLATEVEARPDHSARIVQELQYRPAGHDPVLQERRILEVTAPAADGSYSIDWDSTFKAVRDGLLDRTPLPDEPEGRVFGGYAGLSVRLTRDLEEVRVTTTDQRATFRDDRFRGRSPAMDYTGVLSGREMGVAILDHPNNLNSPSPWYAINGPVMRFFSPAVICYGPHHLRSGSTLRLRYRVMVHLGRWDGERLRREAERFAGR